MKRLFLVLLSGVLFSALCAQTNESSPTPLTERDLRQRAAKTEAIDKLVKAIEANKDTYAQKVQGQIKDSTGEAVGNYELFFNYDKKTQKLLSLLRMERSAEEWYMLQCFFDKDKVIRIDLTGLREQDNRTGGAKKLYYEGDKLLMPLEQGDEEAEGKAYLKLIQELLSSRNKQ